MEKPKHGELLTFSFSVDLDTLLHLDGMEDMNTYMDGEFDRQFGTTSISLTDLSYRPIGTDDDGSIVIEVTGTVDDMDAELDEINDRD